ncbi:BglII/BstYI family type II restriction endonuclease [Brevibacillus borstelensis]|uniref:BglII/BstYI family type II restriction endonuclease n=1 Tax=Brevibacillus borstelensis TaxID=45462 RepID=UPI002E20BFBF|nr:BglII/BstYI family type II restriction endonuclease [Brevibacillus borstelensis]MED1743197.1 BglII/BstYI family type II restriction endonuclease [Brevibacillus borstelensis]
MGTNLLPQNLLEMYEVHEYRHACSILYEDFSNEWDEIISVLSAFRLYESVITTGGGNKSDVATSLDSHFGQLGWVEKGFKIETNIDGRVIESKTHKLDCYKNRIGLEIEWNNKDTFFDRDLDKFRLLFDLNVISVGVIITRCKELQQQLFKPLGIGGKYGASTTHLGKLIPKMNGGGGGGCPILVFGISNKLFVPDVTGVMPAPAEPRKKKKK